MPDSIQPIVITDKYQFFQLLNEWELSKKKGEEQPTGEVWLTMDEAVAYLQSLKVRVKKNTLYQHITNGVVKRTSIAGENRFKKTDLDDFVAEKTKSSPTLRELNAALNGQISKAKSL